MQIKLRKIGNSTGMIVPAQLLDDLGMESGDKVLVTGERGRMVVTRVQEKPVYTLEELMAECDLSAPRDESSVEWDGMQAAGNEIL